MCLQNLLRRRTRSALCIVGTALAVLFVITVAAVTAKYVDVIKEMNVFFSDDVVVVAKGSLVIDAFPIGAFLPESTVGKVREVEGVATATPMLFILSQPSSQEGALSLLPSNVTVGIPPGNWSVFVGSTPLRAGSWPSTDSASQVVIGLSLSEQHNLTVGSVVSVKNNNLQVVGILESRSSLMHRAIIVPLKTAQDVYSYNMFVSMIVVAPQSGFQGKEVAQKIETGVFGTKALTHAERGETVEPILNEVALWNLGIKSMLFLMSMLLVTTVAMINVSEKRRDFATLHAIGAPSTSVIRMVLTETALLGFFGGLIGVFLGVFTTVLMVSFYTSIPFYLVSRDAFVLVSPLLMVETFGSAIVVSGVAGIIPAIAAARTNIAEVLRAEY